MAQLIRNRIFTAKLEATSGTDAVPTVAANAIEVQNFKRIFKSDVLARDNIRGNISPIAPIIGRRYVEISFDAELKNGGTGGVAPMLDALLRAASMIATVNGSSVVYTPNSKQALNSTLTIYVYNLDSGSCVLEKYTGVVLDWSLKASAGQIAKLAFKGNGLFNTPADAALPAGPTYEPTTPPVVLNAAFSYNSATAFIIKELDVDLGNAIAVKDDISSPNGVKGFVVTERKCKGKFSPEAQLTGTYDFPTDWSASQTQAISVQVGSVSGNKVVISLPKVQIDGIQDGNDSGILTKELSFSPGLSSGDDELSLLFA